MPDIEPKPEDGAITRCRPQRGLMIVLALVVLAALLFMWSRQPTRPSPFFNALLPGASHDDTTVDPIAVVFHTEMSRLSRDDPDITLVGGGGGSGAAPGEWYSEQHRHIKCPSEVAEKLMLDVKTWFECSAQLLGVRLQGGGTSWQDGLTRFSYHYEYGRSKGCVNVAIKRSGTTETPTDPAFHSFDVRWDIRESSGPRQPVEVSTPDGNRCELK
jgi:hypothetical protein